MKRSPLKLILSVGLPLVLAAITFSMGNWQVRRMHEKQALHDKQTSALASPIIEVPKQNLDLKTMAYRRLKLQGHFVPDSVVYIDNRMYQGRAAVQVVQAFKPDDLPFVVPVDRGMLLRNPAMPRTPPPFPVESEASVGQQSGSRQILVTVMPNFPRSAELWGLELKEASDIHREVDQGRQVWSNFRLADYQKLTQLPVSNYVATQEPVVTSGSQDDQGANMSSAAGFLITEVALPAQVSMHKGYAIQWYAMTAMLLLFGAYFVYKEYKSGNSK